MATLAENYKSQLAGPTVAGDIKSIKLNIAKLVTIQGGTPATKASSFFNQSKTKEDAYESSFLKKKDTSPTQVSKTSGSSGGSFFDSIGGFFKSLLTGGLIAGAIAVIGKILEDEETRKSIKGLLVDTFEAIFNGIKNIITLAGEALSDPKVIKSIIDVFVELGKQLFNVVKSIDQTLKNELGVPGGLLSVLAVGGTLYAAFALLISALAGLTAAAGTAAAAWGAKVGGSIGPGTKPGTPGTTPSGTKPGTPGTTPSGTKPGAPGTTPAGTAATAEKIAENKAKQVAAERGAMRAVAIKGAAKQFGKIALAAVTGPILGSYLTAEFLYSIANLLSPSELAAVETHTKTLESIQDDVDEVIKNYNDGKITEDGYNRALQGLATKAKTVEQRLDALKKQIIKRMQEEGQDTSSVKKTFEESEQRIAQRIAGDKSPTPVSRQASVRAIDNATIKSPKSISDEQNKLGMAYESAKFSGNAASSPRTNTNLLDLIASAESGKQGYDAANKGKAGDTPNGMPGLSNMTVADVMKLQADKKLFAAGRYQIIPDTLAGLISGKYGNTGVSLNDTFNAETQDKLATALINKRLKQGGGDPVKTQLALSQEFASIADPNTGKSYYEGKGGNKASISTEQIQASLSGTGTTLASNKSLSIDGKTLPQQSEKDPLENAIEGMISSIATYLAPLATQSSKTNQTPVSISSGGSSGGISSSYDNELIQTLIGLQSVST